MVSPNTTMLARQVQELVGAPHLLDQPADCAAYAVQGVTPDLVVAPGSLAELAQVMAAAASAGAAVLPWGGGTQQARGYPPTRVDLVVRTTRLDRVLAYEPADLTISVEAGLTMAALNRLLAEHGQMLPVDVPLPQRATLGGILATASDGPRRPGYGTLRDLFIGVHVVAASGRTSHAGGMVVKNVSGYDMMKLYLGSFGTLALIGSANFKLIPRARASGTIWCAFGDCRAAFALVDALHARQLTPTAVEYLGLQAPPDGHAASALPSAVTEALFAAPGKHKLAVRTEGLPAAVERHIRDTVCMAEQAGALAVDVLDDATHAERWAAIADLPQTAQVAPGEMVVQLNTLPSDLLEALQYASIRATRYNLGLVTSARALSGVAYLRLYSDVPQGLASLAGWHREMAERWPHLVVLAAAPALMAQLAVWGAAPAGLALMQRLKQTFDPHNILNPGRFIV